MHNASFNIYLSCDSQNIVFVSVHKLNAKNQSQGSNQVFDFLDLIYIQEIHKQPHHTEASISLPTEFLEESDSYCYRLKFQHDSSRLLHSVN